MQARRAMDVAELLGLRKSLDSLVGSAAIKGISGTSLNMVGNTWYAWQYWAAYFIGQPCGVGSHLQHLKSWYKC